MSQTLPHIEVNTGPAVLSPTRVATSDPTARAAVVPFRVRWEPTLHVGVLPEPAVDVSIVVPYYNPGGQLRTTVENLVGVLDAANVSFEIIAVSDGSTDDSPVTLEGFPESVVRRVGYQTNVGKGHALRAGLGMGRGRYLGFIDADGDIPPEILASFVSRIRAEAPDIIMGSKRHPNSSVHYTPLRRLYSWGYQSLVRSMFRLDVKDTQVGLKLVDRRVVADVLPHLRESRFALDLELIVHGIYLKPENRFCLSLAHTDDDVSLTREKLGQALDSAEAKAV